GFVTEDTVTFANLTTVSAATTITLPAGGGANVRVGMPLNGPGVAANTFVTAVAGAVVTISNAVGTGAAGNVNFIGNVRLLANFLQAAGGSSLFLHTQGDLNLNATVFTDNGVVKTNAGTLNVGAGAFGAFRGVLQVDAGTVNLGANNSFATIRAAQAFTSNNN